MTSTHSQNLKIGLLKPFGYHVYSWVTIIEFLVETNKYRNENGFGQEIDVNIIQTQGQITESNDSSSLFAVDNILSENIYDIVLLPPMQLDDISEILDKNKVFKEWLLRQYTNSAKMIAYDNAIVLLAFSGLLEEQHITLAGVKNELYLYFPNIKKAGAYSVRQDLDSISLYSGYFQIFYSLLDIVQRNFGFETYLHIVKKFQIDLTQKENRYFFDFEWVFETQDDKIDRVLEKMHAQYNRIKTLDDVLQDYPDSRRNFNRKFLKEVHITPIEYLQNVRIAHAKYWLINSQLSVDEICHKVGYDDLKSFRLIFTKVTGILPLEYRKKWKI